MAKKPEGPIGWTQTPATGEHEDGDHATDVEKEADAHGTPVGKGN